MDLQIQAARRRVVLAGNNLASVASDLTRMGAMDVNVFQNEYRRRAKHDSEIPETKTAVELTDLARQYEAKTRELEAQLAAVQSLIDSAEYEPTPAKRPAKKTRTQPKM